MREMSFCSVMTPLNNLSNKIEILYDVKSTLVYRAQMMSSNNGFKELDATDKATNYH